MDDNKGFIGCGTIVIIVILALAALFFCTYKIPAGYVGVQYDMNGGVKEEVLSQGWHIKSPSISVSTYTIALEQSYLTEGDQGDSKDNERFTASTKEGKSIAIDLTFTYQFKPEDVVNVFNRFKGMEGKEVRDSFIKPNVISWTKEVISKYPVSDIIGSERANINADLSDYVSKKIEPYGITITNVSLINIEVDEDTANAINAKIQAQQNAEEQAINNQTAIDKATADATVLTTQAQAQADAQLIEAEAQAKANKMLNESLSDEVLQQQWIDKWNGQMPTVTDGNSTVLMPSQMGE